MTVSTESRLWTEDALMALPSDGHRYEVIDGNLVDMGNSGMEHGWIASLLMIVLGGYVKAHRLGVMCDSSTAFTLKSGNKRSPDVSFIAKDRLKGMGRLPKGFFEGSPDLAVEVLSPGNTVAEIHDKLVEYFESGTQIAWVIHPDEQYVLVYRHGPTPDQLLRLGDRLEGEGVIPGFSWEVAELFEELDF